MIYFCLGICCRCLTRNYYYSLPILIYFCTFPLYLLLVICKNLISNLVGSSFYTNWSKCTLVQKLTWSTKDWLFFPSLVLIIICFIFASNCNCNFLYEFVLVSCKKEKILYLKQKYNSESFLFFLDRSL